MSVEEGVEKEEKIISWSYFFFLSLELKNVQFFKTLCQSVLAVEQDQYCIQMEMLGEKCNAKQCLVPMQARVAA